MRSSCLLTLAACFAFILSLSTAHGQATFASSAAYAPRAAKPGIPVEDGSTRVFIGKVVNAEGALPGAVVKVAGSKEMAVTNANGAFSVLLPAAAASVQMTVSYAGFADETIFVSTDAPDTTLKLSTVQAVKVRRKQQLKAYMKTAHRQVKRTMRQL